MKQLIQTLPRLRSIAVARTTLGEGVGRWGVAAHTVWEGTTMLRAIIGTVAVLAGFGVLERSVDASTGHAGSCTATQAYALLQRGEVVAVRSEPTPQAAVIGTLSGRRTANGDLARSEVTMTGSQSGWARVALNTAGGYSAAGTASQPFGWIPADLLTVDARVDGTIT